ncbi:MAG: hypothetical protein HRT57_16335, partial [Crocinitomicaceae bacterium]|nr:hypothetical protein [Crocinitomicaceae bacterium]
QNPVLRITSTEEIQMEHVARGVDNVYYWNENKLITGIVATINNDKEYNSQHQALMHEAFKWADTGKGRSRLLPYDEALEKEKWYLDAEHLGLEPKPNPEMIDFVSRSVNLGEATKKRRRLILWSTIVGVTFLAFFIGLSFHFNGKYTAAENEKKRAIKEQNISYELLLTAERETEDAHNRSDSAKVELVKAILIADTARAARARADRLFAVAQVQNKNALAYADGARKAAEITRENAEIRAEKSDSIRLRADSLSKKAIKSANDIADAYKREAAGINTAARAREYLQANRRVEARAFADSAESVLSETGSVQVQSLYTVYTELLPDSSVLSSRYKDVYSFDGFMIKGRVDRLTEEKVLNDLDEQGFQKNKYPKRDDSYSFSGRKVTLRTNGDPISSNMLDGVLLKSEIDTSLISTMCLNSASDKLAIGFKNGLVQIWDLDSNILRSKITGHVHRITSIAFSPSGDQVAMASIDERFSFIGLTKEGEIEREGKKDRERESVSEGERDGKSEDELKVISRYVGSRVLEIVYWNNDVILTYGWKRETKAWGTRVKKLKIILNTNSWEK